MKEDESALLVYLLITTGSKNSAGISVHVVTLCFPVQLCILTGRFAIYS